MLLIRCPYCEEERPEIEFRHAGQAHIARPGNLADISDEAFEEYFFIRGNPKGLYFERWRHIHGCARFFNAARDTVSDKFFLTYKAGETKPEIGAQRVMSGASSATNRARPASTRRAAAKKKLRPEFRQNPRAGGRGRNDRLPPPKCRPADAGA